jgi:hypothetical protein
MTDMYKLHLDEDVTPPPAPHAPPAPPKDVDRNYPKLVRTDKDIELAVKEWCNPATRGATLARCGHISYWDTSNVNNCEELFKDQKEFNDDISLGGMYRR